MAWCSQCSVPLDVVPSGMSDALLCDSCAPTTVIDIRDVVDLSEVARPLVRREQTEKV
jgi:hypothetical protein